MKRIIALLLTLFTVVTTAAAVDEHENIYAVHHDTHKLIALRGRVFRARGNSFYAYGYDQKNNRHIVYAKHVIPGQPIVRSRPIAQLPYTRMPHDTPGALVYYSSTERQSYNEDGGNVYIVDNRREDAAEEVEVKNLPEGCTIYHCAAVPHEGKLPILLKEQDEKYSLAFLDVASGTLGEKRYPGFSPHSPSLIWRGGDLVWQITAGRMCTLFKIYDLKKEQYLTGDSTCGAYYSELVPSGSRLIAVKGNGDVNIITPLEKPRVAADAPTPSDTTLYGIPEQPGDTILCTPGKVYTAGESTFYRIAQNHVNKLTLSGKTHMQETAVFDMTGYTNANPGQNPIISHRYTGEIDLHGGDIILMPEGAAPAPLRVKNLPSGYVIDACAATPCEGKLALHLTHAAEGKCAYALMDTATAAIEGPLHPVPVSQPASLIQRNAHLIWEITKGNAWEIPLTAYDLRTDRRVFETRIDTPKGICILGNTVVCISIHDLPEAPHFTVKELAPLADTIYAAYEGRIVQLPGRAFCSAGDRIYLAEKTHYERARLRKNSDLPQFVGVTVQAYTLRDGQLARDGEPTYVPVEADAPLIDPESLHVKEYRAVLSRFGDVYITPMTDRYHAPRLSIRNMPENCVVEECSPAPVDGYIIALLANTKTQERFYAKLDVRSGMIDGEPIPGAESCGSRNIVWRGGDTIHEISGPPFARYRTFSLSQKAYTAPLLELPDIKQAPLLHGDRLWEVSQPQ